MTEQVGDASLAIMGEDGISDEQIYDRDMAWLESADVVVAEVTTPSLGVGYEISRAESLGKPTICLYRPTEGRRLSAIIAGSPQLHVRSYGDVDTVGLVLTEFFAMLDANVLRR